MPRVCFICRKDDTNYKGEHEDPQRMVRCDGCHCYFHLSCVKLDDIADVVLSYDWKCDRCSRCEACGKDSEDESDYIYCQGCNRAWHRDCIPFIDLRETQELGMCIVCELDLTLRKTPPPLAFPSQPKRASQPINTFTNAPAAGLSRPRTSTSTSKPPPAATSGHSKTARSSSTSGSIATVASRPRALATTPVATSSQPDEHPSASSAAVSAIARPVRSRKTASANEGCASKGNAHASGSSSTELHAKGNPTRVHQSRTDLQAAFDAGKLDLLRLTGVTGAGLTMEAAEEFYLQCLQGSEVQQPSSSRSPERPHSSSSTLASGTSPGRARSSVTASASRKKPRPGRNADGAVVSEDDDKIVVGVTRNTNDVQDETESGTPEPLPRSELHRRHFKRQKTVHFTPLPGTSSSALFSDEEQTLSTTRSSPRPRGSSQPRSSSRGHAEEGAEDTLTTASDVEPVFDWKTEISRIRNAKSNYDSSLDDDARRIALEHYKQDVDDGERRAVMLGVESGLEAQLEQILLQMANVKAYNAEFSGMMRLEKEIGRLPPRASTRSQQSSTSRQLQVSASDLRRRPIPSAKVLGKRRDPGPSA